jgi:hypothetical protein
MKLVDGERFTHYFSPQADAQIHQAAGEVARLVESLVPESCYHSLVLIGGYGRGEGGVRGESGSERPNNNLDFLLISRNADSQQLSDWQRSVDAGLESIQAISGIAIDFSIIAGESLCRSACRIMWYDMRWGHKTILGDPEFVSSLDRFRIERVPSWDVHNLLVNRGTLLVINDCLPPNGDRGELNSVRSRHTIKAVIGYGDALLYAHGHYHWSYAEKQQRMRRLSCVPEAFRRMYDDAAEHRFRPANHLPRILADSDAVREMCEWVHLTCEAKRLRQADLDWNRYLEIALRAGPWEDPSPRGWLKSVHNAWGNRRVTSAASILAPDSPLTRLNFAARWGLRTLSTQRLLGLLFPAVVYDDVPAALRQCAAMLLDAPTIEQRSLQRAYLRSWGDVVDRNFGRFVRRLGISLESKVSCS